jgi:hypothetical protein
MFGTYDPCDPDDFADHRLVRTRIPSQELLAGLPHGSTTSTLEPS